MLSKIIYVSRSSSPMPLELKDILATSRKNNPVFGISGALCFLDGIYMQWFEGEATAVNALYKKIENDPRHTDVKLLVHETISLREHPKWSMALLTWNEETKEIFRAFNPGIGLNAYATDPKSVTMLLRTWSATSNWMIL